MGQAWCRERTSKAQDSKSSLDRVFVRCAHRIYPSLKEEGSVLGGATQRVTSSEIGYAGSPPRELLARGRSIDSVDRPFHPSDWIDVNLEVPSPPRTSTALTNLTVNTSRYPLATTTPTFSSSVKLKDTAPVPPPRRRKRNRSRPLPLKPDEIPESITTNVRRGHTNEEPLHLSVKSPKTSSDEKDSNTESLGIGKICMEDSKHERRKVKEVYEHKVNGTGRIIFSDVVSGKRSSVDKKISRISDSSHHHRKVFKNEEYERFARSESIKDSSTPNRQNRRKVKEPEKQIKDSSRDYDRLEVNTRTKNYSTVSLPNYDELDVSRHPVQSTKDEEDTGEKMKPKRPVRSSTVSLPAESFLSPFSEKTSVLLEDYIPRRGSVEHLSPYQVLGKLGYTENEVTDGGFMKYDPSKLEDWDLGDISNCELNRCLSSTEKLPCIVIENDDLVERQLSKDADVVDSSRNTTSEGAEVIEVKVPYIHPNTSISLQKPKSFGKASSSMLESNKESEYSNNWIADQNRSLRYFDPPTMSEVCKVSRTCDLTTSSMNREPFFLNEELPCSTLDTIEGSCRNGDVVRRESDRSDQSRLIVDHSLSNEREPYDNSYESKELLRAHSDITNKLIRTISEESLPQEMLEDVDDDEEIVDFFDEKLTKDATNILKKDCPDQRVKTPPCSPEPKIKAQILDNDHSTLLKVLNDETAEGSNLSSMTPSLTELEATLSDMLEKEDQLDEVIKQENTDRHPEPATVSLTEKLIEPEIVPVKKHNAIDRTVTDQHSSARDDVLVDKTAEHKTDQLSVSLEEILGDSEPATKTRKVSFCAWEENSMIEVDLRNSEEPQVSDDISEATHSDSKSSAMKSTLEQDVDLLENVKDVKINIKDSTGFIKESFEKSIESPEILENIMEHLVELPTPPRRKNKSISITQELIKTTENHPKDSDPSPNDRLI